MSCWLDYCNSLLYGLPDTLPRKLQSVQNTTARLITGTRRRDHFTPVLRELHWLPDPSESVSSSKLHVRFASPCPGRRLNSYGDRTFAAAGPRLWNSLPVQLRNTDITYGLFRRQLKGHLLLAAWWTRRSVTSNKRRVRKNAYLLTYVADKWTLAYIVARN